MELGERVVLVTGGAHGIGRALCRRIQQEHPGGIAIADRDLAAAQSVAEEFGGLAIECDVSQEADVQMPSSRPSIATAVWMPCCRMQASLPRGGLKRPTPTGASCGRSM